MSNHALVHTHSIMYICTYAPLHNSLQFLIRGQTHTGPRGTSPLGHYHPKLHSEGMSNLSQPLQTSFLQRGATGTQRTQRIHHKQHGEGQWLNPVQMVSVISKVLYQVVGTTAKCDSLVPYAAHWHRVL